MPKSLFLVLALLIAGSLVLTACGAQAPTQAPAPPAQPPAQPQATLPPVKETVVVKETVPVKETVIVQPTAAATATPTATPTAAPTAAPGQVAPKPKSTGKLEFTSELAPSTPRKGDNKIQLTVVLHIKGGAKPFKVQESGKQQTLKVRLDNAAEYVVEYTREWHNCNEPDPQTITVISADGQSASEKIVFPYNCQ